MERPLEIRNVDNVALKGISGRSGKYPQLVAQFSCWSNYQCSDESARIKALLYGIPLKDCSIIHLNHVSHVNISGIHLAINSVNVSAITVEQSTNIHLQVDIYSAKTGLDVNGCNIGIRANQTNHLYVDKLHARNLLYGLLLQHIQTAQIKKSVIEHSGLLVMKSNAVHITSTTCSGNKETGMQCIFCNNTNIVNVSAADNDRFGVLFYLCRNTNIMNTCATNNKYHGIQLSLCYNTNMTNVSGTNSGWVGVDLKSCRNTSIMNLSAINNRNYGMALESCISTSITNVSTINNQWDGMALKTCRDTSIMNVNATKNQQRGILLLLCRNTSITNLLATNNQNGIYLSSCKHTYTTNLSAIKNQHYGMNIESCSETSITTASSTNNQHDGIRLSSCDNTNITNVSTTNSGWIGLVLISCRKTSIITAIVSKNHHGGMALFSCIDTIVTYAYVAHNRNEGIMTSASSTAMRNVSVHNNRISPLSQSQLQLEDSVFSDVVHLSSPSIVTGLQTGPAIIEVVNSTLIVRNCSFTRNNITSIRATNSNIRVQGNVTFADNQAFVGAALHFSQSSVLVISETSNVIFENNYAVNYGGAVYIVTEEMYSQSLSFDSEDILTMGLTHLLTTSTRCFIHVEGDRSQARLIFVNNTAGREGDAVYGGLVALGYDGDWNCLQSFKNVSDMSQQNNFSVISSAPSRVCLCQNDHFEHPDDCLTVADPHTYNVYPGQTITLPAVVVGQDFGTATGSVIAQFLPKPYSTCAIHLEQGQQSTSVHRNKCTNLKYSLYTKAKNCTTILVLKANNAQVLRPMTIEDNHKVNQSWKILNEHPNYHELASYLVSELIADHNAYVSRDDKQKFNLSSNYSEMSLHTIKNFLKFTGDISIWCNNHSVCELSEFGKFIFPKEIYEYPTFINISFHPCPLGFSLSTNLPFKCDCNHLLQQMPRVKCDIQKQTITRDGLVWIGTYSSGTLAASKYCPYNYCKSNEFHLTLQEPDSEHSNVNHSSTDTQCNYRHSGILCGGCQPGLSLALGSDRCLHCSNVYISILLPFSMAGVVLVFLIKFLNLTVSQGTMNALIFYANVVSTNKYLYYNSISINPTTVFIAWFNLDVGIETCFFNGLTAYIRTWLQFVFPLYVWTIAGLIIILAKYNNRMAKLMGTNGVPVLATLFLLSYAKLFNTIIRVLSFTALQTAQGQHLVWSVEGNMLYLGPEHAPLFAVAVTVLVFLWLPYTLLLLLGQWLHRLHCHLITRLLLKLKPFLDAHYAPFKDRHRYWFGLLLLVRVTTLMISAVIPNNTPGIIELATAVLCMLLTFWGQNVYRNSVVGNFATAFFLNLAIMNVIALFSNSNISVASFTLIAIAMAQFVGLVLYKVVAIFKHIPCCVGQREAEDNWELYEEAALLREMDLESDSMEDRESDISGSIDSLPTY